MKKKIFKLFVVVLLPIAALGQHDNKPAYLRDNTNAVLWQQFSGEYRALAFQAYNIARLRLDESLKSAAPAKPRCVVVDIDETVLDNSRFEGYELHNGVTYSPGDWAIWTAKGVADTVPGAGGFLKYAASRGIEVFYVTNRAKTEFEPTLKNLKQFNFPFADEKHLIVKDDVSDKEPRRKKIIENYEIVLFCGDNLNDFADIFYLKDQDARQAAIESVKDQFGKRFIILPNPTYGDWEPPIYDNKKNLSDQEKADMRMQKIKGF